MKIKAVHQAVGWFCLAIVATQIAKAEQIATAWGPHDAAWSDESVEQIFHDLRQSEVVLPCDTWVALPNATESGTTILAKNSDRTLFDCQPLLFHPARTWPEEATVDLGRLTIPQAPRTYATLGSSPYWCWGYEHGINEHGVAIGNEGIRTKVLAADLAAFAQNKPPPIGPTGMDLLRVALERAATAEEALDVITRATRSARTIRFGAARHAFRAWAPTKTLSLLPIPAKPGYSRPPGGNGSLENSPRARPRFPIR